MESRETIQINCKNRDIDIEKGLVDTARRERVG